MGSTPNLTHGERDLTVGHTTEAGPAPEPYPWLWHPYLIVFISSACIMILELVAGRIIAPYVGVSLYTWTSVIGVVLAGISLGNFGGMAGRSPCFAPPSGEHFWAGRPIILWDPGSGCARPAHSG